MWIYLEPVEDTTTHQPTKDGTKECERSKNKGE